MLTIVMGPTCAGKSTYIKEHFDNVRIFDLFDYQMSIMSIHDIFESYRQCSNDLCQALKEDSSQHYILEHTLLKRIRREWYLKNIKEVYDGPIEIICLNPSIETLTKNSTKRFGIPNTKEFSKNNLDVLELPTLDEGYNKVTIIKV